MRPLPSIVLILLCSATWAQVLTYRYQCDQKPLTQVIEDLQSSYGVKFSFDPQVTSGISITTQITSNNPERLIEQIFEQTILEPKKVRQVYLLVPRKPGKIIGKVVDASTGAPLAFAHVKSTSKGALTNQNGAFILPSNPDSTEITISYVGYKPMTITSVGLMDVNVSLEPDLELLPEFIVTGESQNTDKTRISSHTINPKQLSSLPSLGQVDVAKSVQLLPGVDATNETSAGLTVRGSAPDESLVLLDGFTLYHLDHFFGLFSTFNPFMIERLELSKGGFNATYGGRTSAVLDAQGKAGRKDKIHGALNINTSSFNLAFEAPITQYASLIAAYRRSYGGFLNSTLNEQFLESNRVGFFDSTDPFVDESSLELEPNFWFDDFYSKLRITPNDKNVLDFNLYLSNDDYLGHYEEGDDFYSYEINDEANWGNIGTSINWIRYQTPEDFTSISLGYSSYNSNSNFVFSETYSEDFFDSANFAATDTTIYYDDYYKENYVQDLSIKWLTTQSLNDNSKLTIGAELNNLSTQYYLSYYQEVFEDLDNSGFVASGFTEYEFNKNGWTANVGLRGSYYNLTDEYQFEPRLRTNYQVNKNLRFKAAWSIHHQFINQLTVSPFGNSDQQYWVLANNEDYPVKRSRHAILGTEITIGKWLFDLEGYDKYTQGVLESEYVLFSPWSSQNYIELESFVFDGENKSQGLDLLAKWSSKSYTAWASYSWAKSINSLPVINEGEWYYSPRDQRHELSINQIYKVKNWEFGAVFILGSGKPYTPHGKVNDEWAILYDIDQINSQRLPAYHRMDVSAKWTKHMKENKFEVGLSFFNLYNRTNIKSRRYSLFYDLDDQLEVESVEVIAVDVPLLGFTPTISLTYQF